MPRKRTRHNSRKRSLVFTESPCNESKAYCSPVFGATHPVTADTVQIDDNLDLQWVSPQFNPNSENSPPKRRKGTRTRAACSGTASSRQLLLRNESSRSRNHLSTSRQGPKVHPKGFTRLKFLGDEEIEEFTQPSAEHEIDENHSGSRNQKATLRQKPSKQYGGRPMNCSVNQTLNPEEFEVTAQHEQTEGNNTSPVVSRLHEHESEVPNHQIRVRRSCRLRRQSTFSPHDLSQRSRFRKFVCNDEETNKHHQGRVLACDTPEIDYGLRVSLRRRRDLLPLAARNKLLSS